MIEIDVALLRTRPLPDHNSEGTKAARGAILAIGGSLGVPGAILLTAVAALRAGAGKLQIATCASLAPMLGLLVPEALVVGLAETEAGASTRAPSTGSAAGSTRPMPSSSARAWTKAARYWQRQSSPTRRDRRWCLTPPDCMASTR